MSIDPRPGLAAGGSAVSATGPDEASRRLALEWSPSPMLLVDADGRVVLANDLAESLFDYPPGALVGVSVETLVPDRYAATHPAQRAAFLAQPRQRPLGLARELSARRRDGSEVPVEIGLRPVSVDGRAMVLAAVADISRRRHLEELFRRAVEYSPSAMVMIDRRGTIVLVNAQTEAMFGYPREALVGQAVEILVPERFRAAHGDFRGGFFTQPRPRPMGGGRELFGRRADGGEFPVEIGLNPMESGGEAMVLATIVDITERRRAQQKLERALQEKTVLLNEVHHRVKNNLQVISSLLNLQADSAGDPRLREILAESQNRVRAMALTHQLLHEGQDYSAVDLADYLGRLGQLLLGSYRGLADRVTLALELTPARLDLERAIPCGLLVNELVSNAFKHAFPGGRRGRITVGLAPAGPGEVEVSVADDGVGLPADLDLERLGSLGLQLVPLLVDQVQGRLALQRDGGTRFSVRMPCHTTRRTTP